MNFSKNETVNIKFICPQDGKSELEFKQRLLPILLNRKEIQNAYLVQVQYNYSKEKKIALCIQAQSGYEREIEKSISDIFVSMFNENQCLDIIFLDANQEKKIKSICPPFFNRVVGFLSAPDFYLVSSEGYGLEEPRKCWCVRQLSHGKRDDLILVYINPPIIYQDSNEGSLTLDQVILAGKYVGYPIYTLKNWPIHVYVVRSKKPISNDIFKLEKDKIQNIAWAELYPTEEFAKLKNIV